MSAIPDEVLPWELYTRSIRHVLGIEQTSTELMEEHPYLCQDSPKWRECGISLIREQVFAGVQQAQIARHNIVVGDGEVQYVHRYRNGMLVCGVSLKHFICGNGWSIEEIEYLSPFAEAVPTSGNRATTDVGSQSVICKVRALNKQSQTVKELSLVAGVKGRLCELNQGLLDTFKSEDRGVEDDFWFAVVAPNPKNAKIAVLCQPWTLTS